MVLFAILFLPGPLCDPEVLREANAGCEGETDLILDAAAIPFAVRVKESSFLTMRPRLMRLETERQAFDLHSFCCSIPAMICSLVQGFWRDSCLLLVSI